MAQEEPLRGGNVSGDVVRVGSTVRKPWTPATPAVDHLLTHLAERGFDGSPRAWGRDDQGRQVLEYVPGALAHDLPALEVEGLARVGSLVRRLHDLTQTYGAPSWARWDVALRPDRADLVCHNDLAPWNLVIGEDRWVLIDWDNAGPASREWELAYALHGFVGLADGNDPMLDAGRMVALVDGYQLDRRSRERLCEVLSGPVRAMWSRLVLGGRTGSQPWARLYAGGHADHWGPAADYIDRNSAHWRRALV
jgi:Phosphotransferase enzyme family